VVPVTFKLVIQQTPIAGAPIAIDSTLGNTDEHGELAANLVTDQSYTVSSGLEAIYFAPLYDTGAGFAARSPVEIEASRLLEPVGSPCRVLIGGEPNIYLACLNSTDRPISIPPLYAALNSISSVTGQARAPEIYPAGTSGFAVPESHFIQGGTLAGAWRLLGRTITINASPPMCADTGIPGSCSPIDPADLRRPFEFTREVIFRLIRLSVQAAKQGAWRPTYGAFTDPFQSRGARALRDMEALFSDSKRQNFSCPITPMSCQERRVPKRQLLRAF